MTFDEQVAALRGQSKPRRTLRKKADCTPAEWAANMDYKSAWDAANRDKERERNRRRDKKRRTINRERNRKWRADNPSKSRESSLAWRTANPEAARESDRRWRSKNPTYLCNYIRERRKTDPHFRMTGNLRKRQNKFFKGTTRSLSMVRDMGCTQEFFRQHIISQLTGDMTLENYGKVWHLDHIYPLSAADIVDNPIHFLAAANWRNLQPLPGPENLKKSDEVTPEAQALFDSLVQEFTRKVVAA